MYHNVNNIMILTKQKQEGEVRYYMSDYLFPESSSPDNKYLITIDDIKKMRTINHHDAMRGQRMSDKSNNGEYYWNQLGDFNAEFEMEYMFKDPLTSGMLIEYPHGVVIRQSARTNYFRGENRIYPSSESSLMRKLEKDYPNDKEGQALYRMVADMRIFEFQSILQQFQHVKDCNRSSVLYDVLAQHYGLETCWLDVTSDFDVALFFANCYYDSNVHEWYPLTKEQTEKDELSQFGVIYHMPSWGMNTRWMMECDKFSGCSNEVVSVDDEGHNHYRLYTYPEYKGGVDNLIYPIGFQPFMRCSMQNSYAIYMDVPKPLQSDFGFGRYMFRHNEELATWIYEEMDRGKKIYPHEGLRKIQFLIDQIAAATDFSYDAFQYALYRSHEYSLTMEADVREKIESFSVDGKIITISDKSPWRLSSGKRKQIDSDYADFYFWDTYGIRIFERKVIPAGANIFSPYMIPESENEPGIVDFRARELSGCTNIWTMTALGDLYTLFHAQAPEYL